MIFDSSPIMIAILGWVGRSSWNPLQFLRPRRGLDDERHLATDWYCGSIRRPGNRRRPPFSSDWIGVDSKGQRASNEGWQHDLYGLTRLNREHFPPRFAAPHDARDPKHFRQAGIWR